MESQSQNPEFRFNPENFDPCIVFLSLKSICLGKQYDEMMH